MNAAKFIRNKMPPIGKYKTCGLSPNFALVCTFFLACLFHPMPAHAADTPSTMVFGTGQSENSYAGKWLRRIYIETFSRLGMRVSFQELQASRLTTSVDEGAIDGEVSRSYDYGLKHPELIRVDEAVINISFSFYTAHADLNVDSFKTLPSNLIGEYRRGVLGCEKALKETVPAAQLSNILTTAQGLKKLMSKRTDFYCDIDLAVISEMSPEKSTEYSAVRKLFDLKEETPLYPYLNKKHAMLAPRLAAVLKQMKSEGVIERYRQEALREYGYRQ